VNNEAAALRFPEFTCTTPPIAVGTIAVGAAGSYRRLNVNTDSFDSET